MLRQILRSSILAALSIPLIAQTPPPVPGKGGKNTAITPVADAVKPAAPPAITPPLPGTVQPAASKADSTQIEKTAAQPPVPGKPAAPPVPATVQAAPAPAALPVVPPVPAPQSSATSMVRMGFTQQTTLGEVLDFYSRVTGKKYLTDATITAPTPMPISISQEVTKEEAVRIIEIALLMNGVTLVPSEDGSLMKVFGTGKSPHQGSIPIFSEETALPTGEAVVTYLLKLEHADVTEVAQTLQGYLQSGQQPFTQIAPLPKSGAMLITETTPKIRALLRIVRVMDQRPAEVKDEFYQLLRAEAGKVLEQLKTIFEKEPTPGAAAAPTATQNPRQAQRAQPTLPDGSPLPGNVTIESSSPNSLQLVATLSEDSLISGKIKLTADERTNRIHVVTRPVNLPFVRRLLKDFDEDVKFNTPSERPLRHVKAEDIFDALVQAISDPGAQSGQGNTSTSGLGNRPTTTGGQTNRQQNNTSDLFGGNRNSGSGSGSGGSSLSLSESLSTQEPSSKPVTQVVGTSKLIADNASNTIIVIGTQEVKDKVFSLIEVLDRRQPQVTIHTVIGEIKLTDNEQFGVNYILQQGAANKLGGTISTTPGTGTGGTTATDPIGALVGFGTGGTPSLNLSNILASPTLKQIATAGAGGLSGFITAGNAMNSVVTALASNNRFKVVSRPMIFTLNNKRAVISSGEQIAVPTSINSGFSGSTGNGSNGLVSNSTIQFKDVALQLEVLPTINDKREVAMEIVQRVDEQSGSTRIDNNDIPKIATRVIKTNVIVPNEGTLVLGGLIKSRDDKNKAGLPFLSRVPLVGPLFGSKTKNVERTELIILMRPVVTLGPEEDIRQRERGNQMLSFGDDLELDLAPVEVRRREKGSDKPIEVIPDQPQMRDKGPTIRERANAPKYR